jgi:hypothetical protein
MTPRKMPVGIQDFEDIRTNGYVYVDKTAYIYRLATEGKPYFLGRPRRFGKSLLLSTLKAYFQGRKDLFEGPAGQAPLSIAEQEKDWIEYPVFHIDLNVASYTDPESLQIGLDANLRFIEEKWGRNPAETTPSTRFLGLIRRACEKTGRKVVVLVDEYDRPLLQAMEAGRDQEDIRRELKGFYGVLKTADPWLRFVFLAGITKFSQVSVFSDLNQLRDISMQRSYAGICGISTAELTGNFEPELRALAEENGMSYGEALAEMQKRYNGYHFSPGAEGMYNPFSVLNTLINLHFSYYWFQTGTPTYLVRELQKTGFDLREFAGGLTVPALALSDYSVNGGSPVPILYQSGYLTIQDYNRRFDSYTLGFPNGEVEYGFLNSLLPHYMPRSPDCQDFFAGNFIKDLQAGDVDGFMNRLKAFFAGIPYELNDKTERHYQTLFYLVFRLMGQYAEVEQRGSQGRADAVVRTADTVYLFEFKLAGETRNPVEAALRQIDGKGYLIPWTASGKKLVKVGAVFDPATRTPGAWKAV